ncbi:MAG: CoA transferase, partial [Alphaproteobacteria bacterium]
MPLPLERIRVVDFSTLLPGPLATLMLARAGATVVKIEPPGGEGMRRLGLGSAAADRAAFDLLNAGKRSVCADLKSERDAKRVRALIRGADVLVEQFRPGVMERLGFGYAAMKELNPGLIYCSITGYGPDGPLCEHAGHDLNYMARSGVLGLSPGTQGAGCVPPVLAADVAGGSYPAFFNILLALLARGQ